MPVETFKATVTITREFTVEINTDSFNEDALGQFREGMYPFYTYEEHAEHLAQLVARFGIVDWPEGYGPVKYDGVVRYWEDGKRADPTYDINIKIGDEDVETEIEGSNQ